ncbi:plant UBX domain-containing protein 4-like isoform X2 [Arachis stenosperma]|uniref:plant UBX domain-containing protein 4-like isoform X2 n=1 Tax=Arachis stenosperma TaxID=217475 RepID=UPI0025AC7025|nr:plant UBX domain-containing protein 4-like isoform X2 [Arachis stenosperma]
MDVGPTVFHTQIALHLKESSSSSWSWLRGSSTQQTETETETKTAIPILRIAMETTNPDNPDATAALVDSFCEVTSATKQEALFFLESHNYDLDAALTTFLDNDANNNNAAAAAAAAATATVAANISPPNNAVANPNALSESPSPASEPHSPDFSPSPSRSRSASPTPSRAPYELRSKRASGKEPAAKSSGSQRGGIRTLRDLKRSSTDQGDEDDDDDDSDEGQYFYAGGQKSMLVQDPTKGTDVDDIFDQARQSAVDPPSENTSRSRSFTGTGRLLTGETVPSAPLPLEPITHAVTFWRNGFSVGDGPLRSFDDPQNAPFLESIKRSECPKELEPADRGTSVHVSLTRKDENYPEPAKPRHLPFRGVGRTLGSSSSSGEAAGESCVAAPVPTMGLVIDESQPVTSIQLRLADGTRMVSRFNHHHTIRDVRAFIDASRPGGAISYQLQTMGFPPKQLTEMDQTIEQAGIANSVIIQRL